jgi:hypothetical protein
MSNLIFEPVGTSESGKTKLWDIKSVHNVNGPLLGRIGWYAPWRKYTFAPNVGIEPVFDAGCLDEIGAFLVKETNNHKLK